MYFTRHFILRGADSAATDRIFIARNISENRHENGKTVSLALNLYVLHFERKSKRSIRGLPLWHINLGFGRTAKGVIAVGFFAKGVVSLGLFSLGVISFGVLSLGILALGAVEVGLLSAALFRDSFCFVRPALIAAPYGLKSIFATGRFSFFTLLDIFNHPITFYSSPFSQNMSCQFLLLAKIIRNNQNLKDSQKTFH